MTTRSSRKNTRNNPPNRTEAPPEPQSADQKLHGNCLKILDLLESLGMTLGELIHSIFYGNPESRSSYRMREARNTLYAKDRFSSFLKLVYKPPRATSGGGSIATTGRNIIHEFIMETALETFKNELDTLSEGYHVEKATVGNWESMSVNTSDTLANDMSNACPSLWKMLISLAGDWVPESFDVSDTSERIDEDLGGNNVTIKPHPHFGTILSIASLAFRSSRRNNKLQTMLAIYIHAKHTNKSVHNLLHQAGITMSYNWSTDFVTALKEAKRQEAIADAETKPILIVHDNLKFDFPAQSERADHHASSSLGTAITVIVLDESARVFEDADNFGPHARILKAQRIAGTAPQLSCEDFLKIDRLKRIKSSYIMDIIDFLLMVPGMRTCKVFKSDKLKRVAGPQQLPSGPTHRTKFHMLPTVDIDESTYSGNLQVIKYTLDCLELTKTEEKQNRLALERKIPWVGDQVTAQRCETAQFFLSECFNPIDRLEPFIFFYSLFHLMMALAAGTFENSRGTLSGSSTLARACHILNRTGLNVNMNKTRPDYHKVDEALLHNLEARLRGCYLLEAGCKTEAELIAWVNAHSDTDVLALATKVYDNHVSMAAISKLKRSGSSDQARPSIILTNADLLRYYSARRAIKHGDIDQIEDMLPEFLTFFAGSGNSNYAKQTYNFLQLLTHECTPKMK
ncbi:hypothetical protein RhiLY_02328 [Ceratobasidium sp. AG-Ba]|nr:hypothetical protein RhiLY_02328 [Ceratobasidium sp. AG-Ba]